MGCTEEPWRREERQKEKKRQEAHEGHILDCIRCDHSKSKGRLGKKTKMCIFLRKKGKSYEKDLSGTINEQSCK